MIAPDATQESGKARFQRGPRPGTKASGEQIESSDAVARGPRNRGGKRGGGGGYFLGRRKARVGRTETVQRSGSSLVCTQTQPDNWDNSHGDLRYNNRRLQDSPLQSWRGAHERKKKKVAKNGAYRTQVTRSLADLAAERSTPAA